MKLFHNASLSHLRARVAAFAAATPAGGRVLDAGAGTAPFRPLFAHATYETADFLAVDKAYDAPDYVCDLTAIPAAEGRFDRVLLTQVLEHLPDPAAALAELHRVTAPGGRILCTCPLSFEEHEQPHDYFRYTQFALRRLFEGAGWRVVEVSWLEGVFGTAAYHLWRIRRALPLGRRALWSHGAGIAAAPLLALFWLLSAPFVALFSRLDTMVKIETGNPLNYVVLAERPA